MSYAELVCRSNFTFQKGASHPGELIRRAHALGYTALAIADECSLAGIVRAHEVARELNFKLIVGAQFTFTDNTRCALLAPTQAAYTQLCELITRARRAATKGSYLIDHKDFEADLVHCIGIWIPDDASEVVTGEWFSSLRLADKYIGCVHHLHQRSDAHLAQLIELGERLNIPAIAVGDVHYHVRERRRLHDVITATRYGTTVNQIGRRGFVNGEQHLRPIATLKKLFPQTMLDNTVDIAARCHFSLASLKYEYPHELVPVGTTPALYLRQLTEQGARRRWPAGVPASVTELIEKELQLIAELHYEHYFLTVEDIVRFARSRDILCQGRGSAANSAVCYALHVTEVDPARISVLFERFISKERAEAPDIDIDFENQRREEVIQYIYAKYGRARAALAATVVCYRRKMAVRDVGKALGLPLDVINTLSESLHWFDGEAGLPHELIKLGFDANSTLAQHLMTLVSELVGFPRHLSQHVGGFVISEHPLSTLVPLENAAMPERTIIQWDKEDLESLGLLKVDCLALGMLSAIRRTLNMVSHHRQQPFRLQDIPAEDTQTYDMLCRGESIGTFQVESRAQMSMLPRLKPRCFYDLVIQVAIVRPGPIQGGMVHPYLKRRQGLEPVTYPNADLERVLGRTCGVPLFQEQVMQIVMVAAGFSAGEADQVRRSMAAWQRRGGLEHFRDRLIGGMLQRGYQQQFAEQIYQQVLGFGSYGFPESHAASFALLAYASAWLKCHEPAAFCAGLLNSWPMGFYAPAQLIADAKRNGVTFLPVDVCCSEWDCTLEQVDEQRQLRIGLRMVNGFNESSANKLITARSEHAFVTIDDLAHRASLGRPLVNVLSHAGALNSLMGSRSQARWHALGVEKLPALLAGHSAVEATIELPPTTDGQETAADYQSLGFTLGSHPLALLRSRLAQLRVRRADELPTLKNGQVIRVAGLVTHRQRPETASGVIFVSLEDETGISNLIVWPKIFAAQRAVILGTQLMIVQGELQHEQGVIHVLVHQARNYDQWLGELSVNSRDFH